MVLRAGSAKDLPVGKANVYYRDLPEEVRVLLWQKFSEALLPLDSAGKLGVVLFQFPEWFLPGKDSRDHLLQCRQSIAQYRLAVEFRNGAWLDETMFNNCYRDFGVKNAQDMDKLIRSQPLLVPDHLLSKS